MELRSRETAQRLLELRAQRDAKEAQIRALEAELKGIKDQIRHEERKGQMR